MGASDSIANVCRGCRCVSDKLNECGSFGNLRCVRYSVQYVYNSCKYGNQEGNCIVFFCDTNIFLNSFAGNTVPGPWYRCYGYVPVDECVRAANVVGFAIRCKMTFICTLFRVSTGHTSHTIETV